MGNIISFEIIDDFSMDIENFLYDNYKQIEENKKDCYLIIYSGNSSEEKGNFHSSVVVDVLGQSESKSSEGIVGLETHLVFTGDNNVQLHVQNRFFKKSKHYSQNAIYLGKSDVIPTTPLRTSSFIHSLYSDYNDLHKNNAKWSAENNCQTYSRFIIDQIGLSWPEGVPFVPIDNYNVLKVIELYNDIKNSTN